LKVDINIKIEDDAYKHIEETAELKSISINEVIENIVNHQARRELQLARDVQQTIRNVREKEKEGYYEK